MMTIRDIARECNVGLGTVSRVLNGQPGVRPSTREKVQSIIDKYGFVLNQNAKLLKEQDRHTIFIFVKGTSSILLNSLLETIQGRFESLPYTANVVVLDEYDNEAKRACRIFYEQKPLGMIFLGGSPDVYKDDFAKVQVPCVIISNQAHSVVNRNLSSVSTDDARGAEEAAEFLIKNGHTNIGVIGGELESSELSRRRLASFLCAMRRHGLAFNKETHFVHSKYSLEGGASAARTLMKSARGITAIFTMSDVMAIGAMRSLADMGLSVPSDISIIGFDGIPLAEFCCPRLATIRQKREMLVEEGLNALLESIEQQKPSVHTLLPFEFIEGESVKDIRPAL